ncbi:hypothetical protein GCM10020331_007640 [Ectobacillus funiculus]
MTEQSHLSDEQAQLLLRIKLDKVEPNKLLFDNPFAGPILSVAALMSMFFCFQLSLPIGFQAGCNLL